MCLTRPRSVCMHFHFVKYYILAFSSIYNFYNVIYKIPVKPRNDLSDISVSFMY